MAMLTLQDQERVIISYEKEYGSIVMVINKEDDPSLFAYRKAVILLTEIEKYTSERYFDNEFLWRVEAIKNALILLIRQMLALYVQAELRAA